MWILRSKWPCDILSGVSESVCLLCCVSRFSCNASRFCCALSRFFCIALSGDLRLFKLSLKICYLLLILCLFLRDLRVHALATRDSVVSDHLLPNLAHDVDAAAAPCFRTRGYAMPLAAHFCRSRSHARRCQYPFVVMAIWDLAPSVLAKVNA